MSAKNRWSLLALPVILALVAALAFWVVERQGGETPSPPPRQAAATSSTPSAPATATETAPQPGRTQLQALAPALEFRRLDLDTSQDGPEACLTFSEPLIEGPAAHYEDYVSIPDHQEVALQARGPRLCLTGLAFGGTYAVELRAGLAAASGAKLANADAVPISISDKPPLVRFAAAAQFILPRVGNAGVPLTTVNLDEVEIRVYRVSDRALFQRLSVAGQIAPYEVDQLDSQAAALIWSGKMKTPGRRNEMTVTAFPIRELVKPWKPGGYVVLAAERFEVRQDRWRERIAAQMVYDTDLGLTDFRGEDGLNIFVRSIETAKPVRGVAVSLIARDNDELARTTTDEHGRARFSPGLVRGKGASEPLMIMAYGAGGDFNKLLLGTARFDLSDRGVSGRLSPGPLDVFLAAERGIYRPGETVNLVALVRDATATAVEKAPVSLVLHRPDGVEQSRVLLVDAGDGGAHIPLRLSPTAQRGLWTVTAALDGDSPIGRTEFTVDDFVPQRLKLTLGTKADALLPDERLAIEAEARFLYGAAAASLGGEAELQFVADPTPAAAYRKFHFGREEEKLDLKPIPLEIADTDANGKTVVTGGPFPLPQTSLPLKAEIRVGIHEPGGRVTQDTLTLPVRARPLLIGLHPLFEEAVAIGQDAGIEVVVLDAAGHPVARPGLRYELVRRDVRWQWYQGRRGWAYEPVYRDVPVTAGTLDVAADRPATLSLPLPGWGSYRLTVADETTGASTSIAFRSGWWNVGPEVSDTPDKVDVVAERATYRAGETARLTIKPPFDAEVLVTVASNRLFESRELHVPAAGATIELSISEDWGSGAYVMATAYRPLGAGRAHEPVRAVGLSWVGLDLSGRTLAVKLETPDRIRPRSSLTVPVKVGGLAAGEAAHVTLAAVDEGVLQLTRFKTPAPADYYFGKRRLGVAMRDDYGHLLDERDAAAGAIRQGGDAAIGGAPLAVVPAKTVALFSGLVETDRDGRARITLDVPDFQGQLRLMAIAYNKGQVGQGEANVAVRDPVVAEATLPRFLAPGDRSRIALLLHNVEGAAGEYRVALSASGAVAFEEASERVVALQSGERRLLKLPLVGRDVGIGTIGLKLQGPGGFAVEREWQIAVRAAQTPVAQDLTAQLLPGERLTLDRNLIEAYLPGSAHVGVTVSSWRGFNVPALLGALDRYPYGCLEQTTSRAFPLLYVNELAASAHAPQDKALSERVQEAIYRILDMQRAEGDFGLWGFHDSAYPWLSVFALDVLYEARKAGYVVPQSSLQRGIDWLGQIARGRRYVEAGYEPDDSAARANWHRARVRAYAFYLLAKMNAANLGDLRYFHDNEMAALDTALGYGQVAAALAMAGDRTRAIHAFALARQALAGDPRWDYYGSQLRDLAALVAAASEAGETALMPDLIDRLARAAAPAGWTTTQENAWMLIAAHVLMKNQGDINVAIGDAPASVSHEPIRLAPDEAELARGLTIGNEGERPIWRLVAVDGVPRDPEPAQSNGFSISRKFLDLQGNEIDPTVLHQNDRFVVTLEAAATDNVEHQAVLVHLLPAGWEIEGIVQRDAEDNTDFPWLKTTSARMREARDDRFVAALSFGDRRYVYLRGTDRFRTAFIARAAIPGTYALPAAAIEDMYHPALNARTAMGTTAVLPRE